MQRTKDFITRFLNIREGEGTLVGMILLHGILLYIANVFARTSAYTLFVNNFGADYLPYIYIGIGVIGSLTSYIYLQIGYRLSLTTLLLGNLVSVLFSFIFVWLGLTYRTGSTAVFILPIWFGVVNVLNITGFWSLAGRMFTLRQGKRVFGLLGAGEHIATTMAGFAAPVLILWLGTANLLWAGVIALVGAILVYLYLTARYGQLLTDPMPENVKAHAGRSTGLRRYALMIMACFSLFVIGIYFVDNIFYDLADWRFPDENALGAFIGIFFGLVGALSLIMQVFVAGRLLERFGVRVILLATPTAMLIGMALVTLSGALSGVTVALFWLASITNLFRLVMDATDNAAVNVLYQPLPTLQRTRIQTIVNGIIYPASIGLTGLLLLLLRMRLELGAITIAFISLFIILAWVITAWMLGKEYPTMVMKALAARILGTGRFSTLDADSIRLLRQETRNPYPEAVIYALDKLADSAPDVLATIIPDTLSHPAASVRFACLHYVASLNVTSAFSAITQLIDSEADARVLGAALITLPLLDPEQALPHLRPFLLASDPLLRQNAITGFYHAGTPDAIADADTILASLAFSDRPQARLLAAGILQNAHQPHLTETLLLLMQDRDQNVRRAALQAAGRYQTPAIWSVLIAALSDDAVGGSAIAAVVAAGPQALPSLASVFESSDDTLLQLRLLKACGRIGGPEAIALLMSQIAASDCRLRQTALSSLQAAGYVAPHSQHEFITHQIDAETAFATWMLAAHFDIAANGFSERAAQQLLVDALDQELQHCHSRILALLSFLYDPGRIRQIQLSLASPSPDMQSFGVEALDIVLPHTMMKRAGQVLETRNHAQKLQSLNQIYPQANLPAHERMAELVGVRDGRILPWTRACAIYSLAAADSVSHDAILQAGLNAPEPLVSETARHVLALSAPKRDTSMLSILQKVIILKTVNIFSQTPDDVLADVAALLEEVEVAAGDMIISKDDFGDSMYIIVSGEMRVHDGDQTLTILKARDVFGEMALLASEPRSASVTALADGLLLRLDQEPLYELMESRHEVARGIIILLSHRLQNANRALRELQTSRQ